MYIIFTNGGDRLGTTPVRIADYRHAKMKELAVKTNKGVQEIYADAVDSYIAGKYQELILADSKVEQILNTKLNKIADRLAAMLNSNNFDTSTILMAIMHLNSHVFDKDRNEMYQIYRNEGANYEAAKRKKT